VSIGIGLIGLGRHGSRYANHLLEGIAGCHLAAVSRRDAGAGKLYANATGIAFEPAWRQLVERRDVDAVVAVTLPNLNRDICMAAAKAGKALLIEKPLALTTEDASMMVKAARDAGVPMMTAQTLRFTPVLRRLRERLGDVGKVQYLWLSMRIEPGPHAWLDDPAQSGGGVLLEVGIHLLDLVRFLTGEEAIEVSAELGRYQSREVEDLAVARFLFASGVRCYVEVSRVSTGRTCRVEAVGTSGQLVADVVKSVVTRIEGRTTAHDEPVPDRPTIAVVLEEFARSLASGAPMPVSGEDGLRAVYMAESAYRSASAGKPITLSHIAP
jgi:predicted dehydrogenase